MFNLHLNNFRSFINQDFQFSRINILIGENSGGKSSLLKFLLALKQTLDSPNESNLKLIGDYTDLGNYNEVIYNKKSENILEFKFSEGNRYLEYFRKNMRELNTNLGIISKDFDHIIESADNSVTSIHFELNNKLDDHTSIKTVIENTALGKIEILQSESDPEDTFKYLKCKIKVNFPDFDYTFDQISGYKEGFFTYIYADLLDTLKKHLGDDDTKTQKTFSLIAFFLFFQNYITGKIESIRFVNPIGSNPKRFYFLEDKKSSYKVIDIEKFINIIGDKNLNAKEKEDRMNALNEIIKEFGIAEEIKVIQHEDVPIMTLNVKTKGYWSNITDVGYGVSLQIPILFQALLSEKYAKNGQTLLIEQPELHLHPSLQAKFIETLLGIGDKNSYFIETHSEHIIRKLQVLVKNEYKDLKPEDVSIYYFTRGYEKFEVTKHNISKDGKLFPPFPKGFYDTSYNLVKELF